MLHKVIAREIQNRGLRLFKQEGTFIKEANTSTKLGLVHTRDLRGSWGNYKGAIFGNLSTTTRIPQNSSTLGKAIMKSMETLSQGRLRIGGGSSFPLDRHCRSGKLLHRLQYLHAYGANSKLSQSALVPLVPG